MEVPAGTSITQVQNLCSDLTLLKGAELSFLYNKQGVDLVPVEQILIDSNPETALAI